MDLMRMISWAFAAFLGFAAIVSYIPGLTDAEGRTFGIFALDTGDNLLHIVSAAWAAVAAWVGRGWSTFFLRAFGTIYGLDGLMGLVTGNGFLDLAIFKEGFKDLPMSFKIFANAPHIGLGGLGVLSGFFLSRRGV